MTVKNKKILLWIIIGLTLVGIGFSIYLVQNHYQDISKGSPCDFSETVSCSFVNASKYSELFNVPVALLGIIWLLVMALLALRAMKDEIHYLGLLIWSVFGIAFVVYMIIAEILLRAICPFCTVVHMITLAIFGISLYLYKHGKKSSKKSIIKTYKPWIWGMAVIFIIPFILFNLGGEPAKDYTEFAKCVGESDLQMYSSITCSVCNRQKELLGDAFEYIKVIECHPRGINPQTELCLEKNILKTPTWIIEVDGVEQTRVTGFQSIKSLSKLSGCEIVEASNG